MTSKEQRKKHGLNQQQYWSRIGVTQSGGSRYEAGRVEPKPVRMLRALAYGTKAERARVMKSLGL